MQVTIERNGKPQEVKRLYVQIGQQQYVITETREGDLCINQSEGRGILVRPTASNEINLI
jgi:hypothetical protein